MEQQQNFLGETLNRKRLRMEMPEVSSKRKKLLAALTEKGPASLGHLFNSPNDSSVEAAEDYQRIDR